MNKKEKIIALIIIGIAIILTIIFGPIMIVILPLIVIAILFLWYDIKKIKEKPKKIINYINLLLSGIIIVFTMILLLVSINVLEVLSKPEQFFTIFIFCVAAKMMILIVTIMFEKIKILRENKKKVAITIAIIVLIYIINNNFINIKIPYEEVGGYGIIAYKGKDEKIITNMNELDTLYNGVYEEILKEYKGKLTYSDYRKNEKIEKIENTIRQKQEEINLGKQEVIKELGIDNNFFNEYYLVFVHEFRGNTAEPSGIHHIKYNRISRKICFVQKDTGRDFGGTMITVDDYFVKINKKYSGNIEWKTKYIPF